MKESSAKLDISVRLEGANIWIKEADQTRPIGSAVFWIIWLAVTLIGAMANFVLWVVWQFAK